jgi:two-component system nitrogen regulation response regulator NtrX
MLRPERRGGAVATILLVEDDEALRASLRLQLEDDGHRVHAERTAEAALVRLGGNDEVDLLLADVRLDGMSGVELVRQLVHERRLPPTLLISGEATISETVEALRLGVRDFLEKPFSRERLRQSLRTVLELDRLEREVERLAARLDAPPTLLGESPAMRELRATVERVAATDARVLILGESGSGKELVAEAIHRGSRRASGPLVRLNCAAVPATLIEDELFGHAAGAFTDAREDRVGLFEAASGGTLFLDEIGDMEPGLQSRLLRVLEDGVVRRLGENRDRRVDVRIVAATHRRLEPGAGDGTFRADLYYRLAHLPIEVPPLRARSEDVPLLVAHFLERWRQRYRARPRSVTPEALAVLRRYSWPGNVRELEALCERLVVLGGERIGADDLPASLLAPHPTTETGLLRAAAAGRGLTLRAVREQVEREHIESVLQRTGWNYAAAARLLGLRRSHLHVKAKQLGIERPR